MTKPHTRPARIGIDLGGTKIASVALGDDGRVLASLREPSPQGDYAATLKALVSVVAATERAASINSASVGIGMPGSISPATGLVQNANSTWLNGRPLAQDLAAAMGRPVRLANDANCFALSEATDGAAAGASIVFGVILGTGCGGGIVVDGRLMNGPRGIAGEWGHTPLPLPSGLETPGPRCWCGRHGCIETWVSGPAIAADHARVAGQALPTEEIVRRSADGDPAAMATLDRHVDRLARGLAVICNIIDPDVIVLGGGLSQLPHLYERLPDRVAAGIFADHAKLSIRPPRWGDASGVRGAAWLWE
jgi:fructokinase